jgi:sporulation protein YlmC with PRC-barrel domain
MSNIGSVQYSKGDKIGELKAVWIHADYGHGTGLAIGDPNTKFEGKYQIKYFDENGSFLTDLDLEIIKNDQRYDLSWSRNGVVTSIGIGIENSNTLSAGYYDL